MNFTIQKNEYDNSSFDQLGKRIKIRVYSLMHELVQINVVTRWMYILLVIIETAQLLWFMLHPRFEFLWTTSLASGMRQAIKYLQLNFIITQNNSTIFLVCLYTVIGIEVFFALLIVYVSRKINSPKKKSSTMLTYSLKLVSLFAVLMNTVLTIPFFNILVATLYCADGDPVHGDFKCYSGMYLLHFVAAIIGTILLLLYLLIFMPFFLDFNPWSPLPFASPQSIVHFGKLLMKFFAPGYFTIDFSGSLDVQFSAIAGIFWVVILFFRWQNIPFFDRLINRSILICEGILLWSGGVLNIHAFLDSGGVDNIGLLFLIVGTPFIAATYVSICERRYDSFLKEDPKSFKKDDELEMYIGMLINLIKTRDDPISKVQLEGVLKFHAMNNVKSENKETSLQLIQSNLKEETPEKELLWHQWLREILDEGLERIEESNGLHLLNAYLHQEKLSNRFKALYELLITDENKPDLQVEFAIFRYKNIIESEIIEDDNRNSENKGIDVNILVRFQNEFVEFQNQIEKSVNYHADFWRELLEDNPDIQKLQTLSSKITNSVSQVATSFVKICEINNNHTKMLRIYGNFLKEIVNDDTEGKKLREKADYIEKTSSANKQFIDNERLKYGENSNTCIVTLSGNASNLGTVTNINNEVSRILDRLKGDVVGQNINKIMPKIIGDEHDRFMKEYFETSEPKVMGLERIVFPLDKLNYMVPCSLMVKVLPTLDEGIRVVGFLKDLEGESLVGKGQGFETESNVYYIMYGRDNNTMCGVTKNCFDSFGIPSDMMYGNGLSNDIGIEQILPEILDLEPEELSNPNGFVTTLDSTVLHQNYKLENNQDSEGGDEDEAAREREEENSAKYRKTKIRAILIQDEQYKDISNLKILKFIEINEDEENMPMVKKTIIETPNKQAEEEVNQTQDEADHESRESDHNQSQVSVENEGNSNDKVKKLKDAKTLISEKAVPRSIKMLQRIGIVAMLGWLVTCCVNLAMNFSMKDETNEGVYATSIAYERYDTMAGINYYLRKLQLLSRQYQDPAVDQTALALKANDIKEELASLIDKMQEIQFEVIKSEIQMEKRMSNPYPDQTVYIETLLSQTVKYDNSNLTDALFTYLSQASSVRNASLGYFTDPNDQYATQKYFYYVRRNGLGSLRNGSEIAAERFYDFYYDTIEKYEVTFLVLAIVSIVIILLANVFSLPIVSSLHQTNKKVLSMFGYIPIEEIENLALKCDTYMREYLEDRAERKDTKSEENSQASEGDEKEKLNISNEKEDDQMQDENSHLYGHSTPMQKRKSMIESEQNPRKESHIDMSNTQNIKLNNNEDFEESIEKEKVEALHFTRSQKLLNSRKSQNKSDIFKFVFFSATYIAGSLIFFFYENSQVKKNEIAFEHLKLISQGIPQIRYVNVYTLEEIAENDKDEVYLYKDSNENNQFFNSRKYFLTGVQDNEQAISTSEKRGFAGKFDTYKSEYRNFSYGNLCTEYYSGSESTTCSSQVNGLLEQGLKVAVKTIISNSIDLMNQFYSGGGMTSDDAIASSTFTSSEIILSETSPALNKLTEEFTSSYSDFISHGLDIARIWFSVVVVYLLFTFVVLWIPYLRRLRDDIWRTKGMLNMIPMEIIHKNENLSDLFISGELIKSVQ